MSNPAKILPHYTYKDYEHWEGKWEIIDGVPYAVSPAPSPRHQIISTRLLVAFSNQLAQCKKYQVLQPVDYKVSDDIVLQPDILIVCNTIEKKFLDFPPVLVTEVLSPATVLKDRHLKYIIYESQGVKYYLIIDPDLQEAEIYELLNGQYKLMQRAKDFTYSFTLESCAATISFDEIWK